MTTIRTLCLVSALAFVLSPYPAVGEDVRHLVNKGSVSMAPYTESKLWNRIKDASVEYAVYAPIPRIALFDITFPANENEYQQMAGYGLLTISAISQMKSEFPFKRVYLKDYNGEKELKLIRSSMVELSDVDTIVSATFGKFLSNTLYLFPMHRRADPAELVIDFAINREGFVLDNLPLPPANDLPFTPKADKAPPEEVLQELIDREIPMFASKGKTGN